MRLRSSALRASIRRLAPGEVAVHRIELAGGVADRQRCEAVLSADERDRAHRFRFAIDRDHFVVARARLRLILSSHGAGRAEQIRFRHGAKGKPALTPDRGLHFNVSHSGELALIAVARSRAVGVDVERVVASRDSYGIARRFFSSAELRDLEQLTGDAFVRAFFRCWTRKEAYLKARGDGLSLPLDSFDVSIEGRGRPLLRATRPDAAEARRWRLLDLNVGTRYAAALAVSRDVLSTAALSPLVPPGGAC